VKAPRGTVLTLLLLLTVFAAIDAYAATLTVTKIVDTNDGVCDADCSLREAVAAALAGDTVAFSTLFQTPQTIVLTGGQIEVTHNLTIAGPGLNLLSISGNDLSRVFYVSGGANLSLNGVVLEHGKIMLPHDSDGGAIYVTNSTVNLTNVLLQNNTARNTSSRPSGIEGSGGAIYSEDSAVSLLDCMVINNDSFSAIRSVLGTVYMRQTSVSNNLGIAVLAESAVLTILNSTFSDNSSGAISISSSPGPQGILTVRDSRITGNHFGGIGAGDNTSLTVDRTIIQNNDSINFLGAVGGGLQNSGGTATITNSVIRGNQATSAGGGIWNAGSMNIVNSAIIDNRCGFESGGGIRNAQGTLFVTNSTISGNIVDDGSGMGNHPGGGIDNGGSFGATVILTNSTISGNRSTGAGGGIRNDSSGTVRLRNTIVAGNTSNTFFRDVNGIFTSEGFNLIGDISGTIFWLLSDILNVDPRLAPLGNNGGSTFTHALLPGSPAINAGNNALAVDPLTMLPLAQDQRGRNRYVGGKNPTVDIGAFEASYSPSPVTVSGRITSYGGRGIERTRIKVDDGQGNVFYTQTNPFGYYRFNNLVPGTTYTVTVTNKLYLFTSPQFFTADQNRDDLNFITGL
jgi:CSLREA domain-containing protein